MKKMIAFFLSTGFLLTGCWAKDLPDPASREPASIDKERQTAAETPDSATKDAAPVGDEEQAEEPEEPMVLAANLQVPWSVEMFENTFYLTERPGNIVKIENGAVKRQRVELKKELSTVAEAGLLGFVLAPDFSQSNRAYAYYTYQDGSRPLNRIVTLRLEGDVWKEERVLIDRIPSGNVHHGGRLKIGPDVKLYATAGDAANASLAQDTDSWSGKILRMNLDGSIPKDNPFPGSYVYSYGHRNPQGLVWSPDGTLYASEHGNRSNDEINRIEAGLNYGWPVIEGVEQREGFVSPLFTSGKNTTWAPSGMAYANGKLYAAALRGAAVLEFDPAAGKQRTVMTGYGRIRDVRIEGRYLYFITNNTDGRGNPQPDDDKLYRIPISKFAE